MSLNLSVSVRGLTSLQCYYVSLSMTQKACSESSSACLLIGDAGFVWVCCYHFVLLSCIPRVQHCVYVHICVCTYLISTLTSHHSFLGSTPQTDRWQIHKYTDRCLPTFSSLDASSPKPCGILLPAFLLHFCPLVRFTHLVTSLYSAGLPIPSRYAGSQPSAYHVFQGTVLGLSASLSTSLLDDALRERAFVSGTPEALRKHFIDACGVHSAKSICTNYAKTQRKSYFRCRTWVKIVFWPVSPYTKIKFNSTCILCSETQANFFSLEFINLLWKLPQ